MNVDRTINDRVYPVIQTVNGDEKAFWLTEFPYQSPNFKGLHRYQIVYVVRNGKLAEFHTDMGVSKGVKYISIPSYFEYTVDQLRDLADEERNEKDRVDFMDLLQLDKVNLA